MSTKYPAEANQEVDERIAQVGNSLVPLDANYQPQWGSTATLAERMQSYQVPGASLAVIDGNKIAWPKGYGERIAGKGKPVTPQTLFHAGSVAKSLSAAATLTLLEQGFL